MRREETSKLRESIVYTPLKRRPRGKPKKQWTDGVHQNRERLGAMDWEERIQDHGGR